jgi:carbonic anhydrase
MHFISVLIPLFCLIIGGAIEAGEPALTPEKALLNLQEGNRRFIAGKRECAENLLNELQESTSKQKPYAAILCCSDSRVPPELVFDESLGKLFIIRVAGNVATDVTIGSIEYAVEYLKVPVVMVLGHESCGVLVAALKDEGDLSPFVQDLLNEVRQAAAAATKESKNFDEAVRIGILRNVQFQIKEILQKSQVVRDAVKNKKILIKGAIFHFKDGRVEWCS